MDCTKNLIEYYEELFLVSEEQKKFFEEMAASFPSPAKILRAGCGTGALEHYLSKLGHDVTGLETSKDLLESANLKRRSQLMAIRFFLMSSSEMTKFLGKNFYNILSCLNGRITFLRTKETIQNFFNDAKLLLSENGKLIIQVPNIDFFFKDNIKLVNLPVLESIRSKAFTSLYHEPSGIYTATLKIETGSGKLLPVLERAEVYPLKKSEIIQMGKAAGFTKIEFYSDFDKKTLTEDSPIILAVLS